MTGLRYNKKKKPWRSLAWLNSGRAPSKGLLKRCLYAFLFLEIAVLLPRYGEMAAREAVRLVSVEQETGEAAVTEALLQQGGNETREQGILVDWKEGTVKLWQRAERIIRQEPD